jgi:NhaP-type Na+/H+ or K+/H+ antiporter
MTSAYTVCAGISFFVCLKQTGGKDMLFSVSLILIMGLLFGWLFQKIRLPYIIGMLAAGIVFGPHVLNVLDPSLLAISGDLRKIALIIILAKAGLSLDLKDLKRIGRPAVLLCFLPASFEILGFLLFAPSLLHVSVLEAGIIGAVMGAVSPAVIVPRLSAYMDSHLGTKKGIPQMLIAGSSADDVYVIVIFSALISMEATGNINPLSFLQIPESILLGAALGAGLGIFFAWYFKKVHIRDSLKVTILMAVSMFLYWMEDVLPEWLSISGLLAVMTRCILIRYRRKPAAERLSRKFSKLWVAAEVFLFVLVGASVDVSYALQAGGMMVVMLVIGLIFREVGVFLSLLGTDLNQKEKLFCMISELPKATVQAAIGGIPLAMGLSCGNTVLSFAVIAILITAPIGAFAMDHTAHRFLEQN